MNGLERVTAAIQGTPKDRVPLSLTLSLYGAKLTNCPLQEYYSNPAEYVKGQQQVYEIIKPDIIFSPFSLPLYGKAFGSEIKFFKDQPPNLQKPLVKKPSDIDKLDFEKALNSPVITFIVESVKGLIQQLGKTTVIAAVAIGPYDLPVMLMGLEEWLDMLLSSPEKANKLLEETAQFFIELTNRLFNAGATVSVLPAVFVNPRIVTRSIAENILKQSIDTFSQVKGTLVLHSGGTKIQPFLDIYVGLPNVAAFVVNYDDDLIKVRQKLANNQVIIGNIEGPFLGNWNKAKILEKTRAICNQLGDDPNFIFGSSGADIPYNTPVENILIINDQLERYNENG